MEKQTWEVRVDLDPETDELILPLPEDLLEANGWKEGDELEWIQVSEECWEIRKVQK